MKKQILAIFSLLFMLGCAAPQQQSFKLIATGSMEQGDVLIELQPIEVTEAAIIVSMTANTHSVDLSEYDMKKQVTLLANGKKYQLKDAHALNGHHVNNVLVFDIDKKPQAFSITIDGIPAVEKRTFTWPS